MRLNAVIWFRLESCRATLTQDVSYSSSSLQMSSLICILTFLMKVLNCFCIQWARMYFNFVFVRVLQMEFFREQLAYSLAQQNCVKASCFIYCDLRSGEVEVGLNGKYVNCYYSSCLHWSFFRIGTTFFGVQFCIMLN